MDGCGRRLSRPGKRGWVGENKYWILASAAAAAPQGNELPTYAYEKKGLEKCKI